MNITWPDTLIQIVIIVGLAIVVRGVLKRLIKRTVQRAARRAEDRAADLSGRATQLIARAGGLNSERQAQRTRTIGSMLGSLTDATVLIVVVLMVLQTFGVNIAPALASAGIGGLALGFGAQSLVKDIISGLFLMLEDQLGVGDQIDIGGLTGTVQALGMRVTRIQDVKGEIWYVRNGEIATLGNRTQGWSSSSVVIPVGIDEDPQSVLKVLAEVCTQVETDPQWHEVLLEAPQVLGLTGFEPGLANYTIIVKCPAGQQWALEREFRSRCLHALQAAEIGSAGQFT